MLNLLKIETLIQLLIFQYYFLYIIINFCILFFKYQKYIHKINV